MAGNLTNPPLFLKPQVVRGLLGIGHPKRIVEGPVRSDIHLADHCPPSRIYPKKGAAND
ncbi:hypothetical protein [Parasphingorhabdus sp.]|uniref:hypothetical protein n=1 Tax=Parasphingorhabdus sp. TaxID=2709688 RepID=UPI00359311DC